MAGAGYKLFNTGDVLTAAQVNTYLMEQTVMVFNDAASRTTALSGVVAEGMLSYLKSTKQVEVYNGSAWVASDDPNAIQNTIVDAKGDLITATAADTPARLAVGNNGDTLVADSSASVGLRYNPQNALANPFINGGFDIWQRGTSFTGNSTQFTADRWMTFSNANKTYSRQLTNDTTNLPNIQYCLRLQRDSGATTTTAPNMYHSFETTNSLPFAGKTVTLSFYARKGANYSAASDALTIQLATGTGTDQNLATTPYTGQTNIINQSVTLTSTWQRFAITATVGATATEIGMSFAYIPTGTAGANDWCEVTGVQLDLGTYTASSAPTFRRSGGTLAGELAACQRYYYRQTPSTSYGWVGYGLANGTTGGAIGTTFPVQMRITPTAVEYSTLSVSDASGAIAVTSLTLDTSVSSANVGVCNFGVASGLTAYRPYYLRQNASASGYLAYTAEL